MLNFLVFKKCVKNKLKINILIKNNNKNNNTKLKKKTKSFIKKIKILVFNIFTNFC